MSIDGVIYGRRKAEHIDERRELFVSFNGEFVAKQGKIIVVHKDAVLGGHYHDYDELYYMLTGQMRFILEDVFFKNKEEYVLKPHHRIIIPWGVAHKVVAMEDSILLGYSEKPFVSTDRNCVSYDVGD